MVGLTQGLIKGLKSSQMCQFKGRRQMYLQRVILPKINRQVQFQNVRPTGNISKHRQTGMSEVVSRNVVKV